jgi:Sortase domain
VQVRTAGRRRAWLGGSLVVLAMAAATACGPATATTGGATTSSDAAAGAGGGTRSSQPGAASPDTPLGTAGRVGATQHRRWIPTSIVLPGGAGAPVLPASTVDGQLQVPEQVKNVGWWDGGSEVGDPFGSVVIAGHIDSKNQGLGFFARLPSLRVGERVTTRGPKGESATFRIYRISVVLKAALTTSGAAFDQLGDPRLVLITCAGNFDRDHGGYDSNLVVLARPV